MFSTRRIILQSILMCIVLSLGISCEIDIEEFAMTPSKGRSISDFDFLRVGMSYENIKAHVGPADHDIGSGVYVMVYQLSDGKELHLSFASLNSLLAVYLYNPDDNTHELLNIEE